MEDYSYLIKEALIAREYSYSPYSNFAVGAAVLCEDGMIFTGCNIENASYPAGICAERTAISKAVSEGHRVIKAIAIVGGKSDEKDVLSELCFPCGICRQVLREFSDPARLAVVVGKSCDDYEIYALDDLLPHSFGPNNLK